MADSCTPIPTMDIGSMVLAINRLLPKNSSLIIEPGDLCRIIAREAADGMSDIYEPDTEIRISIVHMSSGRIIMKCKEIDFKHYFDNPDDQALCKV